MGSFARGTASKRTLPTVYINYKMSRIIRKAYNDLIVVFNGLSVKSPSLIKLFTIAFYSCFLICRIKLKLMNFIVDLRFQIKFKIYDFK